MSGLSYVLGGTLPPDAPSYVERQADRELVHSLHRGETCYVLNSRQMGKSSICVRTIGRLKALGTRTAFLDLTKFGGRNLTAEQWYAAVLSEVGRELGMRSEFMAYWKENSALPPVRRLFGAITELGLAAESPLVVFFDEIDVTLSLPFSADEFFAAIRQCYVGRASDDKLKQLSFCLLGTATPSDLIQDTRVSPFNIGKRIELRDFTEAEAAPLAAGLGDPSLLRRVLHWTGGHPYLTQRLCRAVQDDGGKDVDRVCSDLFLTHAATDSDDNLAFVRNRLLKSEADLPALLDLYRKMRLGKRVPDDETNPLCAILKLSGVAKVDKGTLQVRNSIYRHVFDRHWVETHMPDAEKRRQKEAYRRGLFRSAALGGVAVTVFAVLAALALKSQNIAIFERDRSDLMLYEANMRQVQQDWDTDDSGHAQELLVETKNSPYKGFEWYYWQSIVQPNSLLLTLRGHTAGLIAVAYSADGKFIATASSDKTAKIWDAATGANIRTLKGHTAAVIGIVFSQNGKYLATASNDKTAKIWDLTSGREIRSLTAHGSVVNTVCFSHDGRRLATGSEDCTVKVWDVGTGAVRLTLEGHTAGVSCVTFSPDDKRIATAAIDTTAKVWDAATGQNVLTLTGHTKGVYGVAFSPDGKRLATCSDDKTIKVWDAATGGNLLTSTGHRGPVFGVTYSPNGKLIATASAGGVSAKLWDALSGKELRTIRGHTNDIWGVAFSPDSKRLVTASLDGLAKVWDIATRAKSDDMVKQADPIYFVALSRDGKRFASASKDGSAKLWDMKTHNELRSFTGHSDAIIRIAFSPDSRRVATGSYDKTVRVWDTDTGRQLLLLKGHLDQVPGVAYSNDGRKIATASFDHTAKIWDTATGTLLATFRDPDSPVACVAFSPDDKRLATGTVDNATKIWDVQTGRVTHTLKGQPVLGAYVIQMGVLDVSFSPDGSQIASASVDRTVTLWDSSTGRRMFTLKGHRDTVSTAAYSHDGTRLATSSADGTAKLWNPKTGGELLTLTGHVGYVDSVSFSADDQQLVTASEDGTVRFWKTATPADVERWNRENPKGETKE